MQVDVVSPEEKLFSGDADEVYARSTEGEIGIMAGHLPVLLALEIARVKVVPSDGRDEVFAVHGGFLEFRNDKLSVLADSAERVEDIDVQRAQQARQRAEQAQGNEDDDWAQAAIRRADLRIELGQ